MQKQCRVCGKTKPVSDFYKRTKAKDGYQSRCKDCSNEDVKTWRNHHYNTGTVQSIRRKVLQTARKYGVTPEQQDALHEAAGGKCGICAQSTQQLVIDHCHTTGEVRGLLCNNCNTGLGMFKDNPQYLRKAINYLRATSSD